MEHSSNQDASFASLKDSIDDILQIVKAQSEKKDESDLLMHILASKVDVQGQRLISLEKDVREIKATVKTISELSQTNQNQKWQKKAAEILGPDGDSHGSKSKTSKTFSSSLDATADYFDNADKVFSQEIAEVKCLVREEVRGLGNVCIQCSTDVIMKLDQADKTVFSPLVEATSDLRQVMRQMEDIDKGIRTIENTTNQYSYTLTSLKDESLSKDEFRSALQEAVIEINTQSLNSLKDQSLSKDEFRSALQKAVIEINTQSLNSLKDQRSLSKDEFRSSFQEIKNNTEKLKLKQESNSRRSFDESLMTRQFHLVLEQIIAENQITREIIQNTRKIRKTYKCDFFVHDFSKKINSGEVEFSNVWYFDQLNTHGKGYARFNTDGNLNVWLVYGKHPRKLGLDAKRSFGADVKVFVVNSSKMNWQLTCSRKCNEWKCNENAICTGDGWDPPLGTDLVTVSCTKLAQDGFVHDGNHIVLRFEIVPY